jgi:hypothetical protein
MPTEHFHTQSIQSSYLSSFNSILTATQKIFSLIAKHPPMILMLAPLLAVLAEAQSTNDGLVFDFPDDNSTYSNLQMTGINLAPNRFGIANTSYDLTQGQITGSSVNLPNYTSNTVSFWMSGGIPQVLQPFSAGTVFNFNDYSLQVNPGYFANYSSDVEGLCYFYPGMTNYGKGYFGVRFDFGTAYRQYGSVACGGYFASTANEGVYNGSGVATDWTHYAVTYTKAGYGIKIYINGTNANDISQVYLLSSSYDYPYVPYSPPNFVIGGKLTGVIDTLQVYNRVLNNSEIINLFLAQSTPPAAPAVSSSTGSLGVSSSSSGFSSSGGSSSSSSEMTTSNGISSSSSSTADNAGSQQHSTKFPDYATALLVAGGSLLVLAPCAFFAKKHYDKRKINNPSSIQQLQIEKLAPSTSRF